MNEKRDPGTQDASGWWTEVRRGCELHHRTFGKGTVVAVDTYRVTVKFPEPFGTKVLKRRRSTFDDVHLVDRSNDASPDL